jgi:hypothetical protein
MAKYTSCWSLKTLDPMNGTANPTTAAAANQRN